MMVFSLSVTRHHLPNSPQGLVQLVGIYPCVNCQVLRKMCSQSHVKANGLALQGELTEGMIFVPFVPQQTHLTSKVPHMKPVKEDVCLKRTPQLTSLLWPLVYRWPRHGQSCIPSVSYADLTKIQILPTWKVERNSYVQPK